MDPIKLVLFDLDDTLVHFDDYWEISVKETFKNHFYTKDMNEHDLFEVFNKVDRFLVGKLDSRQISIEEYRINRFLYSMEQVGETSDVETAIDFERLYQSIGKKNMKPNMKVIKLISDLSNHYRVGVLTNGSKGWQLDKLEAIGLYNVFPNEYIFISEEVGHEKPSPEIYHHVLNTASLQPEQVLIVGDSIENDVLAPIQQGFRAILLNNKDTQKTQISHPLTIITELEELRWILLS
ncbi:HAD family hydrolase [Bacillus solimangrovi]|uniref:HAD family hydrolase n=1 Tax=Bacillus solimangrovi TaxID=1305675 RepID=A0A1E5LFF2_9BACI|nr:HAD family hydrolase [Bacillus solimangrovi]OEH92793.1 hypothetical protein BFG57_02005 [Bacillus solimangrovi]